MHQQQETRDLYDLILRDLLLGTPEELRELLKSLSSENKEAVFELLRPLLDVLRRVATTTDEEDRPLLTLPELIAELEEEPETFGRRDPLPECRDAGLFNRVQVLQVGLAPKRELTKGLSRGAKQAGSRTDHEMISAVGWTLAERPEPWSKGALLNWLTHIERRVKEAPRGLASFFLELWEAKPEWREELRPLMGKAAALDGFRRGFVQRLPNEMILAGLAYDGEGSRTGRPPIAVPKVVGPVVILAARDPEVRGRLIETALDKLQGSLSTNLESAWIKLIDRLQLRDSERIELQDRFEALLQAPGTAAARLGLTEPARLLDSRPELTDDDGPWLTRLATASGTALGHSVQSVATEAWGLLRGLSERRPELRVESAPAVVRALTGPLREEVLPWLRELGVDGLGAKALEELQRLLPSLDPETREALADLLPDDGTPGAAGDLHDDGEFEIDGTVEIDQLIIEARRQASLSRPAVRRLMALEAFREGQPGALELAAVKSREDRLYAPPFRTFEDAESMVEAILAAEPRDFHGLLADRVLDGICRFPVDGGQAHDLGRRLHTAAGDPTPWWIAHVWLQGEAPPTPPAPPTPLWFRRLRALQMRPERELPLGIPSHDNGRLDPEVFASRYLDREPHRDDDEELETALYRLTADEELRRAGWERLLSERPNLAERDDPADLAVTVALAPEELAEETFERARTVSALGAMGDRLLCAALRSRHGLGDVGSLVGDEHLDWLRSQVTFAPGIHPMVESYYRDRMVHPVPMKSLDEQQGFDQVAPAELEPHHHLMPYTAITPGRDNGSLGERAAQFPPAAQRYFEAGLLLLERPDATGVDRLLDNGRQPQVSLASHFWTLAELLIRPGTKHREQIVGLLAGGLEDGRVTPSALAAALMTQMRKPGAVAEHVDAGLASLSAAGPVGALTVQLALESLLAYGMGDLSPETRSLWLERLELLIRTTGRAPSDPQSRQALEGLARSKDFSGGKARAVLEAGGVRSNVPLRAHTLAVLLRRSLPEEAP